MWNHSASMIVDKLNESKSSNVWKRKMNTTLAILNSNNPLQFKVGVASTLHCFPSSFLSTRDIRKRTLDAHPFYSIAGQCWGSLKWPRTTSLVTVQVMHFKEMLTNPLHVSPRSFISLQSLIRRQHNPFDRTIINLNSQALKTYSFQTQTLPCYSSLWRTVSL